MLLELQVLPTVSSIRLGILEMVVSVDFHDQPHGVGREVRLDEAIRPEPEAEFLVELKQSRRLGHRLQALEEKSFRGASGTIDRFWFSGLRLEGGHGFMSFPESRRQ